MKFALKTLVAAVAVVAAGGAFATQASGTVGQAVTVKDPGTSGRSVTLTLQSGTGTLAFSNGNGDPINGANPTSSVAGLVGALNVANVVMTPVDGAKINEVILPVGGRVKTPTRALVSIDAAVTKLTADIDGATAGRFTTVNATGGAIQTAAFLANVLEGGTAKINNLEIDLVNKKVYADALGNAGTAFENSKPRLAIWTFDSITGPTTLSPASLLAAADGNTSKLLADGFKLEGQTGTGRNTIYSLSTTNIIGGLKATTDGFNFFADALGLTTGSVGYNTLLAVNTTAEGWGSMKSYIKFTAQEAIPEPSTYALMGLGLVGISLVARRRAAK